MTNSDHEISIIQDEERPYDWEVWCSCTRFAAVGLVHRAWYEFEASTADRRGFVRRPTKQEAIDWVAANHTPAEQPAMCDESGMEW